MNTPISDYKMYNGLMQKSMLDKIYFLDKIPATDCFVDFGCADGELLRVVQQYSPNAKLIGYDNDCKMIEIAKGASKGIDYTCKWDKIKKTDNATLILSSVLHEVMHYSTPAEIRDFWNKVRNSNFKYIVLRDMIPSRSINRPSDMDDVAKLYAKRTDAQIETFENVWGSVENNKNLIHFLLKYTYVANWYREVRENYLACYREDIMRSYPINEFEVVYHEHYTLPYLKWQVKRDFDIDIKDNTHLKLILKRK